MNYIMSETSQTEFQGFDNLLAGLSDDSSFVLGFFPFVLNLDVHLPAYIFDKIREWSAILLHVVEIELGHVFIGQFKFPVN